ncbi:MAG: UDP-N-acetylmuramate--L-alanine ligase [Ruminococcaceae bacterium]|nr:UDP-N-acetylmuramate--L-alanine ligase [Oscillospiraceae bacterium]
MSDIKESAHIHFIGIGGISMSALAHICIKRGYIISGSDINETHITRQLTAAGAKIYKGHSSENVNGADLVVYTAAINAENEELIAAKQNGILCVERSIFLGAIMRDYKSSICVAGTHGKTTTTSMLSHVLLECECDPTIMLGGELDVIGGNMRVGESEYFLTEACEYHCSFLEFFPRLAIITNVDEDHLDFFKDIEHIKQAFCQFAEIPDENGYVIVCGDDKNAMECVKNVKATVLSYGFDEKNIFCPKNLKYNDGCGEFDVEYGGKIVHVRLGVAGEHNVLNALAGFASAYVLGLDGEKAAAGLEKFTLVHRRFEKKGENNGACIIDDYAHHPTEIMCTLKTARSMCKGKLYVVFQPHTYTRTKALLDEFSKAFDDADKIIVTDIYAAREKDTGKIHASDLSKKLSERGQNAVYISSFDEIALQLESIIGEGDIVITMGAGNVYKISEILTEK